MSRGRIGNLLELRDWSWGRRFDWDVDMDGIGWSDVWCRWNNGSICGKEIQLLSNESHHVFELCDLGN